jgi:hypothetical protein
MNCCDEYGECRQGRDCPIRVAKVGKRMPGPEPLRGAAWRHRLKDLASAMLLVLAALLVGAIVAGVLA